MRDGTSTCTRTRIVTANDRIAVNNETQDIRQQDNNKTEGNERWTSHFMAPEGHTVNAVDPAGQ